MATFKRSRHRSFFNSLSGCLLVLTLAALLLSWFPSRAQLAADQDAPRKGVPTTSRGPSVDGPSPAEAPQVALTFDDLPAQGPLPKGMTRVEIAKSIVSTLRAAHAPLVYGFVNAKGLQIEPEGAEVLAVWQAAGFPLANHTFSHMDLDTNSAEDFEHDILANEPTLSTYMKEQDWHWLRYPFLREGDTPEKHRAVLAFLKEHGYKVAQVTISFGDYAYNAPYARCLSKNDQQGIDQLKKEYLQGAAESLEHSSILAKAVLGRDIKHVMLLHVGSFETVMLPHLLDLLRNHGYKLITLPEAQSDPAYSLRPDLRDHWDGSFLDQFVRERHLSVPPDLANAHLADLEAVCR